MKDPGKSLRKAGTELNENQKQNPEEKKIIKCRIQIEMNRIWKSTKMVIIRTR